MDNLRLFKFRFFSKKQNKFIHQPRLWCSDQGLLQYDYDGDDLIITQWTGLKDRKGTEIYEGDMVWHPVTMFGITEELPLVVEYDNFRGRFEAMMPESKEPSFPMSFKSALLNCKVFGNIFENSLDKIKE